MNHKERTFKDWKEDDLRFNLGLVEKENVNC